MIATLLTLLVAGVLALVVLSVVLSLAGVVVALLFKLLPILIIGYVMLRLLAPRRRQLSAEDREWLKS